MSVPLPLVVTQMLGGQPWSTQAPLLAPGIQPDMVAYFTSSPLGCLEAKTSLSLASWAFQIAAVDAVACALCALCFHWGHPEDMVVAAVHYGGDTDTIGEAQAHTHHADTIGGVVTRTP